MMERFKLPISYLPSWLARALRRSAQFLVMIVTALGHILLTQVPAVKNLTEVKEHLSASRPLKQKLVIEGPMFDASDKTVLAFNTGDWPDLYARWDRASLDQDTARAIAEYMHPAPFQPPSGSSEITYQRDLRYDEPSAGPPCVAHIAVGLEDGGSTENRMILLSPDNSYSSFPGFKLSSTGAGFYARITPVGGYGVPGCDRQIKIDDRQIPIGLTKITALSEPRSAFDLSFTDFNGARRHPAAGFRGVIPESGLRIHGFRVDGIEGADSPIILRDSYQPSSRSRETWIMRMMRGPYDLLEPFVVRQLYYPSQLTLTDLRFGAGEIEATVAGRAFVTRNGTDETTNFLDNLKTMLALDIFTIYLLGGKSIPDWIRSILNQKSESSANAKPETQKSESATGEKPEHQKSDSSTGAKPESRSEDPSPRAKPESRSGDSESEDSREGQKSE